MTVYNNSQCVCCCEGQLHRSFCGENTMSGSERCRTFKNLRCTFWGDAKIASFQSKVINKCKGEKAMKKKNLSHSRQKSFALRLLTVVLAAMLIAPPFFVCSGESSAVLAENSATRYECETASVGTSATYQTETDAANASGGVYASNTNNVMFVYAMFPNRTPSHFAVPAWPPPRLLTSC